MLSNVSSQNARRRERLAAVDTFVWTFSAVYLTQAVGQFTIITITTSSSSSSSSSSLSFKRRCLRQSTPNINSDVKLWNFHFTIACWTLNCKLTELTWAPAVFVLTTCVDSAKHATYSLRQHGLSDRQRGLFTISNTDLQRYFLTDKCLES